MNLETRKRLAAPFYWLAGVFLTLANKTDGPQPRKAKVSTRRKFDNVKHAASCVGDPCSCGASWKTAKK